MFGEIFNSAPSPPRVRQCSAHCMRARSRGGAFARLRNALDNMARPARAGPAPTSGCVTSTRWREMLVKTIAAWKAYYSAQGGDPPRVEMNERTYDGLREAGLPEE